MKAAVAILLVAVLAVVNAQGSSPMGPQVLEQNKATLAEVGKGLGSQPIAFVALIKLKPGADANKFVAVREAVAAKARKDFPNVNVAYLKGALPAKQETLPQGGAKLEYWPVAALVTAPDAKTYADYNAKVAKDPNYVASGQNVEQVVRATNVQL